MSDFDSGNSVNWTQTYMKQRGKNYRSTLYIMSIYQNYKRIEIDAVGNF